ncbi:unnamed protein product, partial [marine sediment metagenome]
PRKKNMYLLTPFKQTAESIMPEIKNKPAKPLEPTPVNHKTLRNIYITSGNIATSQTKNPLLFIKKSESSNWLAISDEVRVRIIGWGRDIFIPEFSFKL